MRVRWCSLGKPWLSFDYESHIHAWNMARGWFGWHKDLVQLIYGQVVRGSPKPSWILHSLIRVYFLHIIWANLLVHMWHLWLMYPYYFCCLYFGYKYVWWQWWFMDLIMFWFVNEWIMNIWPNRWSCSYCDKASMLFIFSQIIMRPLC